MIGNLTLETQPPSSNIDLNKITLPEMNAGFTFDRRADPNSANTGDNLHVRGLSHGVDSQLLKATFTQAGRVVKAEVVYDPQTRESRGFGFVTMESPEEAEAAIAALSGTQLWGRAISIEKARRARARTPTPGKYYGPPKLPRHGYPLTTLVVILANADVLFRIPKMVTETEVTMADAERGTTTTAIEGLAEMDIEDTEWLMLSAIFKGDQCGQRC
ncbi:hypothetical protein V5O48_004029 [Marasmius crinis-equi]|uniref:RRM domain-containing protein n=1 Tax=Marasmius crinis-equi TaxID=585013 RepID=A0ABR3FR92_9AGAR